MDRRGFLVFAGLAAVGGCTEAEDVTDSISTTQHSHLKELEWRNDQKTLSVTFPDEHDADYIILIHEYDEETAIWYSEAPRFSGPVNIPMMEAVACDDADYPTPVFELIASNGQPFVDLMDNILDRREVEVDEEWLSRARQMDLKRYECAQI